MNWPAQKQKDTNSRELKSYINYLLSLIQHFQWTFFSHGMKWKHKTYSRYIESYINYLLSLIKYSQSIIHLASKKQKKNSKCYSREFESFINYLLSLIIYFQCTLQLSIDLDRKKKKESLTPGSVTRIICDRGDTLRLIPYFYKGKRP